MEIIDWSTTKLFSLPLLRKVTNEDITVFIISEDTPDMDIKKFLCHTQIVERCERLVTEAFLKWRTDGSVRRWVLTGRIISPILLSGSRPEDSLFHRAAYRVKGRLRRLSRNANLDELI
ncbi:hypothetical protein NPIL_305591 [Nephila pilipes]|uniref:Uncharacterized protein n=1 Tax=Nephila pilipes TaxID=299642 RepID=A0A8X6NB01_NEPPI|nr:hypothetical protein NPIL_305591 [Nephila pilipes]